MKNTTLLYGFWDRVDQAVKLSGMTQSEIARKGRFDRKALCSHSGSGRHTRTLAAFCTVTDVSADWLLFGGEYNGKQ